MFVDISKRKPLTNFFPIKIIRWSRWLFDLLQYKPFKNRIQEVNLTNGELYNWKNCGIFIRKNIFILSRWLYILVQGIFLGLTCDIIFWYIAFYLGRKFTDWESYPTKVCFIYKYIFKYLLIIYGINSRKISF